MTVADVLKDTTPDVREVAARAMGMTLADASATRMGSIDSDQLRTLAVVLRRSPNTLLGLA